MPTQLWLADAIADEFRGSKGFQVDVYPGWQTRGSTSFDPDHVMDHHTGGGTYNNLLKYMAEGPRFPPLCNIATSRPYNGVVRITIVAAGRANHSGVGIYKTIPRDNGNYRSIGIENQNDGLQSWPDQQMEAMRRLDATLLIRLKKNTEYLLDHKTYAPTRKVDRHTIDVAMERKIVTKIIQEKQNPPKPVDPWEEFWMSLTPKEQEIAKDFFAYLAGPDGVEKGSSFARQFLLFNREERGKLRQLLDAIDYMDSSPTGQGKAISALWREAGARGWDRDWEKFKENKQYTEGDLENKTTL